MKKKVIKFSVFMAIITISTVTLSITINAQEKGDIAIGVNMVVWWTPSQTIERNPSYTNTGIGAKFSYNVISQLRLAGEFDYFSEKDFASMWDCRVYSHYLFPVAVNTVVYPSIGIGMIDVKTNGFPTPTPSTAAFTIGIGADCELSSNLILNGEIRHHVLFFDGRYMDKNYNHSKIFNFAIGLAYKFNTHKSN